MFQNSMLLCNQTQIAMSLIHTWIFVVLASTVACFYIKPLRAGTIQLLDKHFREKNQSFQLIDLSLDKHYYQSHKDIQVVATMTSLAMDENLNFKFLYQIVCPTSNCMLNFTLTRYTKTVNPNFIYSVTVDYIVAHGLVVMPLDMTAFQQHVLLSNIETYDKHNKLINMSEGFPENKQDAWFMMLFPNGFQNVTLTGHVVYSYIVGTGTYVVHFMDHSSDHGEHDSMGWPEGKHYIRYMAVFVPHHYITDYHCEPEENFDLTGNYERICDGGSKIKWMFGLKGTKETQIQGEFFELRAGFSFKLNNTRTRYGLMAFPFESTEEFQDKRIHEYKWQVQYKMLGWAAGGAILLGAIVGIVLIAYLMLRKYLKRKHNFGKIGKDQVLHQQMEMQSAKEKTQS